jgi:hypothetical protein
MKILFTTTLLVLGLTAYGQNIVTLTEDLVLSETLVISEDTNYEGNGFKLICEGCSPAIRVDNGSRVHFQDTFFPRVFASWLFVEGGNNGNVTWDSSRMRGQIKLTRPE